MTCFACLFEAKSIQDYILRSGRLRHIVGASELIDSLTRDLLTSVLDALKLSDRQGGEVRFSRRAGGAVYLFSNDAVVRDAFRDLWTLTVRQYAPGLSFVIADGEGHSDYHAYQQARDRLLAARNRQATALPAGTPVTRYAPRTGLPAVRDDQLGLQDEATARFGQEQFWKRESDGLIHRFAPASHVDDWPRDLNYREDGETPFPFRTDSRYLGLLHADGNGLGQLLMNLGAYVEQRPDQFITVFSDLSQAIQDATEDAARFATREVLAAERRDDAPYPARPIVLGGDDLTLLIRADLALPFARKFLERFEQASREQMTRLRVRYADLRNLLPDALTAGAGIAFVKSNHPFYMAHELTEGLAKFAKDRAKDCKQGEPGRERIPPTLAFYRVTTASHGDYAEVREEELTFGDGETRIVTSLGAYGLDPQPQQMPALSDLEALAKVFAREEMARGPARQLLTLIGLDLGEARRRYARWREVMRERDPVALEDITSLLVKLCGGLHAELPINAEPTDAPQVTPLADLVTLLSLGVAPDQDQDKEATA